MGFGRGRVGLAYTGPLGDKVDTSVLLNRIWGFIYFFGFVLHILISVNFVCHGVFQCINCKSEFVTVAVCDALLFCDVLLSNCCGACNWLLSYCQRRSLSCFFFYIDFFPILLSIVYLLLLASMHNHCLGSHQFWRLL